MLESTIVLAVQDEETHREREAIHKSRMDLNQDPNPELYTILLP